MDWRRADDMRALVATCVLRAPPAEVRCTVELLLSAYRDDAVGPLLSESFCRRWRPALVFHLAQAGLSFEQHQAIGRLLRARLSKVTLQPSTPPSDRW